ncbi:MAG: diguanylate cyclase [Lachnospiraceae bacterium]|nr:diguanylate cyclase [Lachnospiraceae bacterium]
MSNSQKGKIYYTMQAISLLPILLLGLLILAFGTVSFTKSMTQEVFNHLDTSGHLLISLIDSKYPGDYILKEQQIGNQTIYSLYKGNQEITGQHHIVDHFKEDTAMDVTLFYKDTRILTTITNWENQRIIGTSAPEHIMEEVQVNNEVRFYNNALINGEKYFACYHPLTNADGTVVGMLFVGKPIEEIKNRIDGSLNPIIVVGLISLVIASIISYSYAKRFVNTLHRLKNFLKKTSTGNLNVKIDSKILNRNDEFSEIAHAALSMQKSLRNIVELDGLTNLLNRRTGEQKLRNTYLSSGDSDLPFTIVMADIDYFKSINDTYGHHNGDVVLKNIAGLLKEYTSHKGYAIRWGGEEFMLVFENHSMEETRPYLEQLQAEIREFVHTIEETEICVTMTFGVACDATLEIEELIELADDKLYEGKSAGRNCIIF